MSASPVVIKLQEFIKKNPSSLPVYSDVKEEENNSEMEDTDDEDFVSKKEIEIGKLEDQIRYLKLDLNNEQLRVHELEDLMKCLTIESEIYINNIKFTKDYIALSITKPFDCDINMKNLLSYNTEMIESTKQFEKVNELYKNLINYEAISFPSTKDLTSENSTYKKWLLHHSNRKCVDKVIYDYYVPHIKEKFQEIKTSHENMKNSLLSLNKRMEIMKKFIIVLCIINFLLLLFSFPNLISH